MSHHNRTYYIFCATFTLKLYIVLVILNNFVIFNPGTQFVITVLNTYLFYSTFVIRSFLVIEMLNFVAITSQLIHLDTYFYKNMYKSRFKPPVWIEHERLNSTMISRCYSLVKTNCRCA